MVHGVGGGWLLGGWMVHLGWVVEGYMGWVVVGWVVRGFMGWGVCDGVAGDGVGCWRIHSYNVKIFTFMKNHPPTH